MFVLISPLSSFEVLKYHSGPIVSIATLDGGPSYALC
jgi:hypothetical protein